MGGGRKSLDNGCGWGMWISSIGKRGWNRIQGKVSERSGGEVIDMGWCGGGGEGRGRMVVEGVEGPYGETNGK